VLHQREVSFDQPARVGMQHFDGHGPRSHCCIVVIVAFICSSNVALPCCGHSERPPVNLRGASRPQNDAIILRAIFFFREAQPAPFVIVPERLRHGAMRVIEIVNPRRIVQFRKSVARVPGEEIASRRGPLPELHERRSEALQRVQRVPPR